MKTKSQQYSLDELVEKTGFSERQIRYYITLKLVAGAGSKGPNAAYGEEALERLLLIRKLKEQVIQPTGRRLSLKEIGQALGALDGEGISALLSGRAELAILDTESGIRRLFPPLEDGTKLEPVPQLPTGRWSGQDQDRHPFRCGRHEQPAEPVDDSRQSSQVMKRFMKEIVSAQARQEGLSRVARSERVDEPKANVLHESPAGYSDSSVHRQPVFSSELGIMLARLQSLLEKLQHGRAPDHAVEGIPDGPAGGESWWRLASTNLEIHIRVPQGDLDRRQIAHMAATLQNLLKGEDER
jgi:DNA-binding transcriptional MerR regulator